MRQHAAAVALVGVSFTFIEAERLPTQDQSRLTVVLVVLVPAGQSMVVLVVLAGSIPNN
jgi:hypothetical protein